MIYEIPLAAVAKKTLAFAWVVDDILRESLADDETDERYGTVVDRLVSGAGPSETNKVPCGDLAGLISDDFRPTSRQNVDGLFIVSVRVELRRLVARRNRDHMNANILEAHLISQRFVNSNCLRVEIVDSPNTFHCGNLFSRQMHRRPPSSLVQNVPAV